MNEVSVVAFYFFVLIDFICFSWLSVFVGIEGSKGKYSLNYIVLKYVDKINLELNIPMTAFQLNGYRFV